MSQSGQRLASEFADKDYRHSYADNFLNTSIAAQIRALRDQRGWTQAQLAERAEMKQSRISAMEDVNYSSWSIRTLARLGQAFDVTLAVCFKSFSERLADIEGFNPSALVVPPYTDDLLRTLGVGAPPSLNEASPLAALSSRLMQIFIRFNADPIPTAASEVQESAAALLSTVERMYGKTSKQYREFQEWVLGILAAVMAAAQSRVMSKEQEEQAAARIKEIDAEIERLTEENRAIREQQPRDIEAAQREAQLKIEAAWQAAAQEIERVRADSQRATDAFRQAAERIAAGIAAQREAINRVITTAITTVNFDDILSKALSQELRQTEHNLRDVEQRAEELVHA
jgi:transcriptional regulator with XRE-family HTH domain